MREIITSQELLELPEGAFILIYGRKRYGYWPHLKICSITRSHLYDFETRLQSLIFPTNRQFDLMRDDEVINYCYIDENYNLSQKSDLEFFGITPEFSASSVWVLDDDEVLKHVLMEVI